MMVSTARRTRRGRRCSLMVAGAAVGLLTACSPATSAVQVAAATAPVQAAPWTNPAPFAAAPLAAGPGLQVPQPPRPVPVGTRVVPFAPVGIQPTLAPPTSSCGDYGNPRRIIPGAVPGAGSATLSWQADGHSGVQGYRVSAVSQRLVPGAQPPPVQQTIAQAVGCRQVSVTVTGLTTGVPYVFWLEEQSLDSSVNVVRYVQVGESSAVVIG